MIFLSRYGVLLIKVCKTLKSDLPTYARTSLKAGVQTTGVYSWKRNIKLFIHSVKTAVFAYMAS